MVNRVLVGAHYGLKDWVIQRATAGIMIVCTAILLVALIICRPSSFIEWHAFMTNGVVRLTSLIFILGLCWHAWIGVRDIWLDYAKPMMLRLVLVILTATVLIGYAVWATQILWRA